MAKRGRPTVEIRLTGTECRQLQSWARRHSSAQALAMRCKIVLACADPDLGRQEIADRVGCNPAIDKQPGLLEALDELVHPDTRGTPMSALRWTLKSSYQLARDLQAKGFRVSAERAQAVA